MAALGGLAAVVAAEGRGGRVRSWIAPRWKPWQRCRPRQATQLAYQYRRGAPLGAEYAASGTASLIPDGVFPCADGYMALMSTPQQLDEMLDVLDDDAAKAAFARPDAFEARDEGGARRRGLHVAARRARAPRRRRRRSGPVGRWPASTRRGGPRRPTTSSAGLLDPHRRSGRGPHRPARALVPVRRRRVGPAPARPRARAARPGRWPTRAPRRNPSRARPRARRPTSRPAGRPCEGIRVLDLTAVWAGPYATMLLGRPRGRGDPGREPVRAAADHEGLRTPARSSPTPGSSARSTDRSLPVNRTAPGTATP